MKRFVLWSVLLCLTVAVGTPLMASGYSIYEHSAKASGQAGAWVARADDAAANWYNPAALVRQGSSFQVGFNGITIGGATELTTGGTTYEPESSIVTPVHLYYARKVNDKLAWGIGINTPYGLATDWDLPFDYAARKSELMAVNVNVNAAFAMNEYWSFGFGLNYLYADIKDFSSNFNLQSVNPGLPDTFAVQNLHGDGTDWGFNLGLQYRSDAWAFALTWRGAMKVDVDGQLDFSEIPPGLEGFFPSMGGAATLPIPSQAAVGFAYLGWEDWELEFDVSWAGWDEFDSLVIDFDNGSTRIIPEDWTDTRAYRLGVSRLVRDKHDFRLGVVYDENPVPDHTARPSIPDADRYGVSVGYGWSGRSFDLDFYYMALFFNDRTIPPYPWDPSVIPGKYESFTNLFGLTFSWRFD